MKVETFHLCTQKSRWFRLFLLPLLMLILFIGYSASAAVSAEPHRYRESGKLSNVEKKNNIVVTVTIDDKGYIVDPSALIVNTAGRPTSLDKFTVPVQINFEYSYMENAPKTMSPVIVYIEETKTSSKNGRSMQ